MKAIEFLNNKGITKATCYTDSGTYYVNALAELMEEYALLRQQPVIKSVCPDCNGTGTVPKDQYGEVLCIRCSATGQTVL